MVPPTLLTDTTPDMTLYHDEIFGAVTTVLEADDTDARRHVGQRHDYGLTAGVISENLHDGIEVARRLRTGIVHVNDQTVADEPQAPFGGVQDSGYGKFGGQAGIDSFSRAALGDHPAPRPRAAIRSDHRPAPIFRSQVRRSSHLAGIPVWPAPAPGSGQLTRHRQPGS